MCEISHTHILLHQIDSVMLLSKNGSPPWFSVLCNCVLVHNEISGAISHPVVQAVFTFQRTCLSICYVHNLELWRYWNANHTSSLPWMIGHWLLLNFVIRSLATRYSVKGNVIFPSVKFHLELKQTVIMKCSSLVILVILKIISCVLFHSYK